MHTRFSGLLLTAILIAAGCGSGDDTAVAPTGTSDAATTTFGTVAPDDDPLERRRVQLSDIPTVVFDGTECLYTGPESVELGAIRITVDNQSDSKMVLEVSLLPDDKTWEDVVAYVGSGEAATAGDVPEWISQSREVRASAGRDVTVTRQLDGGDYALTCFIGESDALTVQVSAPLAVLGEGKFCVGICGSEVTSTTSP